MLLSEGCENKAADELCKEEKHGSQIASAQGDSSDSRNQFLMEVKKSYFRKKSSQQVTESATRKERVSEAEATSQQPRASN